MVASSASSLLRVMLQALRDEVQLRQGLDQEGGAWRDWWLPELVSILYSSKYGWCGI